MSRSHSAAEVESLESLLEGTPMATAGGAASDSAFGAGETTGDDAFGVSFLHGWRRHVRRGCTGHLMLVKRKRELRSRLQ